MLLVLALALPLLVQLRTLLRRSERWIRENYLSIVRGVHLMRYLAVYVRSIVVSIVVLAGQATVDPGLVTVGLERLSMRYMLVSDLITIRVDVRADAILTRPNHGGDQTGQAFRQVKGDVITGADETGQAEDLLRDVRRPIMKCGRPCTQKPILNRTEHERSRLGAAARTTTDRLKINYLIL